MLLPKINSRSKSLFIFPNRHPIHHIRRRAVISEGIVLRSSKRRCYVHIWELVSVIPSFSGEELPLSSLQRDVSTPSTGVVTWMVCERAEDRLLGGFEEGGGGWRRSAADENRILGSIDEGSIVGGGGVGGL